MIQSSLESWYLKYIHFNGRKLRFVTSNFKASRARLNPRHLTAPMRRFLRGNIQPPTRRTVSYEFFSQLAAEYLLTSSPDVDVSAALYNALYSKSVHPGVIYYAAATNKYHLQRV
jgi:hypothetical protein